MLWSIWFNSDSLCNHSYYYSLPFPTQFPQTRHCFAKFDDFAARSSRIRSRIASDPFGLTSLIIPIHPLLSRIQIINHPFSSGRFRQLRVSNSLKLVDFEVNHLQFHSILLSLLSLPFLHCTGPHFTSLPSGHTTTWSSLDYCLFDTEEIESH